MKRKSVEELEKEIVSLKNENSSLRALYEKDISERNVIEDALRESDNLFRAFMDNLKNMIIIKDRELRPVFFNNKIKEWFPADEWLGRTPDELFPPEIAEKMKEMDLKVFEEKNVEYDEEWIDMYGNYHIFETRKFLIDRKEKEPYLGAIITDITERKKVEKALLESEEKYRTLVQYASDPIFSFNPDESYRFVNSAFAKPFGKTPEEIIGKTPHSIFPFEEAEKRLTLVRRVFLTSERGEIEVKVVTKTGDERYFLTIADPIKDEKGKVLWVSCISKDITERKRAEEEIRHKNEQLQKVIAEKDKFVSILAHDLKSPLHGILGLTKLMATSIDDFTVAELTDLSRKMYNSADNLYKLLDNLLEWVRMEQGTLTFNPEEIDLSLLVTNSIGLFKQRAEQKEIKIYNEIEYSGNVYVDEKMIETVLRNILSNAIKFTEKGGEIYIRTKKIENMIELSVADTGIGIEEDVLNKLFRIEEKIGRRGTEGEESTGLGLLLSKEFVEKNGGLISVKSEIEKGSTFYFTLPIAKAI